ncbi:hypothetical protein PoB_002941700 [Plakobranchus ocellatus]|uniref:Uncharacterized protein n=1 Tax=Plakobranchus ocellatus TaxID=259542 RepID=A0AAV4A7L8_9GAST|nr:hypothetical protein PoB_002941700 [Plakobranchus ocellatus]
MSCSRHCAPGVNRPGLNKPGAAELDFTGQLGTKAGISGKRKCSLFYRLQLSKTPASPNTTLRSWSASLNQLNVISRHQCLL